MVGGTPHHPNGGGQQAWLPPSSDVIVIEGLFFDFLV